VAADLGRSPEMNHQFWRDFRKAVKEANPNAIILAEHYGDPKSWLGGDQWDSIMNYNAFMEPITWLLTGMEKHSDERREDLQGNTHAFVSAMKYHMARMHYPSLAVSMNELSNHDHSRFLTRTNHIVGRTATVGPGAADRDINKAVMRAAVVMQMTWPGAPTIYYGDEAGVTGWTDPDNRRTYPWGHEDHDLIRFHKDMIKLHKAHEALMKGSIRLLECKKGMLSYGRFTNQEKMIILVNSREEESELSVSVWEIDISSAQHMRQLMITREHDFGPETAVYEVKDGKVTITLPGHSAAVFIAEY
jgi:alpha-glucosidase